jgi:hypothetical protein
MLAPEMGAREVQAVADEVGEMRAGLGRARDWLAIHDKRDLAHWNACSAARRNVTA